MSQRLTCLRASRNRLDPDADIDRIMNAMVQADSTAPACPDQEDQVSLPPDYSAEGNVFRVR